MRCEYIHNLRGLAILLVVLAHSFITLSSIGGGLEYIRYILINCSVFFVVIGGFLFAEISPKYTFKRYLLGKLKNVIIPYIIISLPAALIYILKVKTNHSWVDMDFFYSLNFFLQYAYLMITGAHLGPLWFIPMIIVIYLMFPFFNLKTLMYPLLVCTTALGVYVGRPELNSNVFQSFLYFLPAYVWGIWLHQNQWVVYKLKISSLAFNALIISLCMLYYYYWGYGSQADLILKLLLSLGLFCLFAQYYDGKHFILNKCAQLSFFIFFIHGYFIGALRILIFKGYLNFNAFTVVIINFSLVLACSFITYYLLTLYLPKNKWFLLGISK